MPHVVLTGKVDLLGYARAFEPLIVRQGRDVLRADKLYVEGPGRALLLEALAVESGRKLSFYIKASGYDGQSVTVRIDPLTHPERSEGVKQLVACVAADILRKNPEARIETTNLVLPSAGSDTSPKSGEQA